MRNAEPRRRVRRIARSGLPVHPFELLLEGVVEEDVPLRPEKPEERAHAIQALHDQLLFLRQLNRWVPTFHARTSWRTRDHAARALSIVSCT
jgi:hypothetical protein